MAANKLKPKNVRKASKKKGDSKMFFFFAAVVAAVILPTSFLLFIGMLPTIVCVFVSRGKKTLAVTVGAMNLASCSPFLLNLWMGQHDFSSSLEIVMNPWSVVVMFSGAAFGYILDWSTQGIVKSLMLQNAVSRQKQIKKRQAELIERWGKKVTGTIPLDKLGHLMDAAVSLDEDDGVSE